MTSPPVVQHGVLLAAAIAAVLIVASTVAYALKLTVAKGRPHAVIDNLTARIHAWWVIAAALGASLSAGRLGTTALFAFASFLALREFESGRDGVPAAASRFGVLTLLVQYGAVAAGAYPVYSLFIPIFAFVALPLAYRAAGASGATLARQQWALVLCVYCVSFVPALCTLDIPGYEGRSAFLLLFLVLVAQGGDVLQYLWGKAAGRHKLAPAISPSKTIEGAVGGGLSAIALGAALAPLTPFTRPEAALIAGAISVLGVAGGLLLSAIKRRRGIKDWGTLISGHGGMLDRLDSLCLSAPAYFYIVRVGWAS